MEYNKQTEYFAALPNDKIAPEIMKKIEDYYEFLLTSGKLHLYRRSYEFYYRSAIKGGKLVRAGEQGEYTTINVNHYRNLLKNLQTMTTSQRPAFEARATNSDVKSQEQTILANSLLDYYMREKHLERYIKMAVEHSLVFGEGFLLTEWDAQSGEMYGVNSETGAPIYEGDLKYTNFTPIDVIRDFLKDDSKSHDWYITRSYENRFNLAAKYPELSEKIRALPSKSDKFQDNRVSSIRYQESEDVPVFTMFHRPCPALPNGRLVVILSDDIVLIDSPLPYRKLPLYRIAPGEEIGTTFGYSVAFDLLPIQEALDNLYSTAVTNQMSFGVQNVAVPAGSNLSVSQLGGGLNLIEYDSKLGKPESMNLTQTPPEIFNFMQMLERLGETISGVNSVARGNPEASLKSGAALALVQSMAIQFNQDLQQSYAQLLEDVGTSTINILRDFSQVPRVAMIVGKSSRSYMKSFKGDDLSQVNRVMVDMANPLTRTTAGKVNLAETLLQNNLVESADQYISVLTTGRLEPIIESKQSQLLLIRQENEDMAAGKPVSAMITDKHELHIMEHAVVAASTESRRNPAIMAELTKHLQEHIDMLKTADPVLLKILGQNPVPGGEAQSGNVSGAGEMLDATNPVAQEAARVNQPNMPSPPPNADPNSAAIISQMRQ